MRRSLASLSLAAVMEIGVEREFVFLGFHDGLYKEKAATYATLRGTDGVNYVSAAAVLINLLASAEVGQVVYVTYNGVEEGKKYKKWNVEVDS